MNQNNSIEKESALKILDAAREEFARVGIDGARVDRIAAKAGVNKAMLYYHFGSKENLYLEVIRTHLTQIRSFVEQTVITSDSPEEALRKIASFYQKIFMPGAQFLPIFLRELAAGGGRLREAFTAEMMESGLTAKVRDMIERGKQQGAIRNVDSRHAIISFMGMNIFYYLAAPILNAVWEIDDAKEFRERRAAEVLDLFLHGLLVR